MQTVIESMQQNLELQIDYQPFYDHRVTFHIQPYAMKVYHQRWYIVGYLKEKEGIRNIALDRILELELTNEKFHYPDDFDANKYYSNTIGVYVNEKLKPQKVVIRAFGIHVEYMRTLPLHVSQNEIACKHQQYSDFQYKLCLTPELSTKLLAMGENVEVLEPVELREEIKNRLASAMERYK